FSNIKSPTALYALTPLDALPTYEDLDRVVAGDDHARDEHAGHIRLHRLGIVIGDARDGIDADAEAAQEARVRRVARHGEHEVVAQLLGRAVLASDDAALGSNLDAAAGPPCVDRARTQARLDVGPAPRLD